MPWTAKDAKRHTKKAANSAEKRQWSAVANAALKSGDSEGSAIRQANAVIARRKHSPHGTKSLATRPR